MTIVHITYYYYYHCQTTAAAATNTTTSIDCQLNWPFFSTYTMLVDLTKKSL